MTVVPSLLDDVDVESDTVFIHGQVLSNPSLEEIWLTSRAVT